MLTLVMATESVVERQTLPVREAPGLTGLVMDGLEVSVMPRPGADLSFACGMLVGERGEQSSPVAVPVLAVYEWALRMYQQEATTALKMYC